MKSRISSFTDTTGFIVPQSSGAGGGGGVGFCVEHADAMTPASRPVAMVAATQAARFMCPECTAGAPAVHQRKVGRDSVVPRTRCDVNAAEKRRPIGFI